MENYYEFTSAFGGGHCYETHVDEGVLNYMIDNFKIQSFLDIGCGPGGMLDLAFKKGLKVLGIDGDYTLHHELPVIVHDYTLGVPDINDNYDLCWSCEFLEHVEEQYIPNFMNSFLKAKYLVVTHALPEQGGHHHVNCQEFNYWKNKFYDYGFIYSQTITNELKKSSTMRAPYFHNTGIFFENSNSNLK